MNTPDIDNYMLDNDSTESSLDFQGIIKDVIGGLVHGWLILLVIVSMSATIGFVFEKVTYKANYKTSASFIVDISNAITYDNNSKYQSTMAQISKTFPALVRTSAFQKMLLSEMGLDKYPDGLLMSVTSLGDTSLITIYIFSPDPQLAYDMLQAILKCYPEISEYVLGNIDMKMVENTGMPTEPIKEEAPKFYGLVGAAIGFVLFMAILCFHVTLKKTVRKEEDFNNLFNISCYGTIPMVHSKKRSKQSNKLILFNTRGVGYEFNEAIRTIRTRIERDHNETGAKVYMVSSAIPGEGKSTVTINLALALAEAEKKVLLVDMDVRNPSIMKTLGRNNPDIKLKDIFEKKIQLHDAVINDVHDNLSILAIGRTEGRANELLNHPGADSIIREAKEIYEYIFIDTAPSGFLSDAASIAQYADACIYVVCQDYAPVERIKDGIDMLTEGEIRISGCILNMSDSRIFGYGYNG